MCLLHIPTHSHSEGSQPEPAIISTTLEQLEVTALRRGCLLTGSRTSDLLIAGPTLQHLGYLQGYTFVVMCKLMQMNRGKAKTFVSNIYYFNVLTVESLFYNDQIQ